MKDEINLWKEKTKGVFHIVEYKKFWNYITNLQEENERLEDRLDTVKIKISELMSKYFYEKDFSLEDTHLDKLLRIIDGDNILQGEDNE